MSNYYNNDYNNSPRKRMFLDIETLPAPEHMHEVLKELHEYKKKKKKRMGEKYSTSFESFLAGTGFDGTFGRILCVSYAINDDMVHCICNEDEKKVLESFWEAAKDVDLFVGFNIIEFDMKYLVQRSIVHGVKPKTKMRLTFAKYRSEPMYDVMHEWNQWSFGKGVGLDALARALGLPTSKTNMDGSEVYAYYKKGKIKEICTYCDADVEVTRKIYKRMNFE
ncbi:MAG TPA: ribonuclease H-like domain-containing protein [Candidatus Bathyarchaeia archaeon]|nr:ribonuclease H-like domain-containing protein [Candidatus Bathyarchaeia archaeon]